MSETDSPDSGVPRRQCLTRSVYDAGRNFNIRVDPTGLSAGLHCAEIRAYDTATPGRVVFTIPVTVCKPETVSIPSHAFKEWRSMPGTIERRFLAVPEGVTWAELRFSTRNHASPVNLWVHCVQLQSEARLSKTESQSIVVCTSGETVTKSLNVVGGVTLEICAVSRAGTCPLSRFAPWVLLVHPRLLTF